MVKKRVRLKKNRFSASHSDIAATHCVQWCLYMQSSLLLFGIFVTCSVDAGVLAFVPGRRGATLRLLD